MSELRVLASVYACGPNWGSEVGMGWNWVRELSRHVRLTVITEAEFRDSIEAVADTAFAGRFLPEFHYIEIDPKARAMFWKQNSWGFYPYYRRWQLEAKALADKLLSENSYDLVHQLNMVGYREPGFLWQLNDSHKLVWGPISGFGRMPHAFMPSMGLASWAKYALKDTLNALQRNLMPRIGKALRRADALVAVTRADAEFIQYRYKCEARLIPETGTRGDLVGRVSQPRQNELNLAWCGVMEGAKALQLALRALALLKGKDIAVKLHIIGDGSCCERWQREAIALGVNDMCVWYGRKPHDEALKIMSDCDAFCFTSWREATSTVIMEALSLGLPVITLDCCGMATAVTVECGIKIPLTTPRRAVLGYAEAMEMLAREPQKLTALSRGALDRAPALSFEHNVGEMLRIYAALLSDTETAPPASAPDR